MGIRGPMRAAGRGPSAWTASTSGIPKASVFPDPVGALPETSRPAIASTMVADWMGKGWVIPRRRKTSTRSFGRPSWAKEVVGASAPRTVEDNLGLRSLGRALQPKEWIRGYQ